MQGHNAVIWDNKPSASFENWYMQLTFRQSSEAWNLKGEATMSPTSILNLHVRLARFLFIYRYKSTHNNQRCIVSIQPTFEPTQTADMHMAAAQEGN